MNLKPYILALSMLTVSPCMLTTQAFAYDLPTDTSQKMKPATIKVLLVENAPNFILEVSGRHQIYNPSSQLLMGNGVFAKRGKVSHEQSGMKWGEIFPGTFQMRIVPGDSQTTILVNGKQYRGCVEIYDDNGKFSVINEVDVENFLHSTLTSQVTQDLHSEALSAIAIVARTNTYHLVSKQPAGTLWNVKASDVGYEGYGATLQNMELERAIEQTRHAIMTYHNAPFAALWTENSAGKTADYASIYRKNVATPSGVEIPLIQADRQKFSWSLVVSKGQLAHMANINKLAKISLFSEKQSGKVYAVKLSDGVNTQDVSFFDLQNTLGKSKLKSNDFSIEVRGDDVIFQGYGAGDGVGLCLYSAELMAKDNQPATKILASFFPDTKIEKLRTLSTQDSSQSSGEYLR